MEKITRRDFLRVSALVGAGTIAAACAQPAAPTTAPPAAPTTAPAEPAPPSRYGESPVFADMVAKGELPPVDERLPENPCVAVGLDGIGNYGGGWRLNKKGQADGYARGQVLQRGLLKFNQDLNLITLVAESYEGSEDGTEWTFHLRKGMKWSDGAPFTAEDFRFWYEDLILNREYTVAHPKWLASIINGEVVPAEFSAPDDYTIKYTFAAPSGLFNYLGNIVNNVGTAVPAHFLKPFHPDYGDQAEIDALQPHHRAPHPRALAQ